MITYCHPAGAKRLSGPTVAPIIPGNGASYGSGRFKFLIAALLIVTPLIVQAQPSPYKRYRTLDTEHFHVHVPVGLELEGRVAAAAAERAYGQLAKELKPPRGPIDLVVTDDADYSNGYATPQPTNRIVVFATPPIESNSLRLNEDWLALVITHELTHIFHLDRADGL
ncbi:MAG: WD40-like beta Propeller containing protein, partial [Gemmatimonadetes bacterium]|nr:WD40-like beta Propeller containing protein [Gemmatimonadota bacterium]